MPSPKLSDRQIIDCVINDEKDTCMQPLEEDNDKEINIISNKDALSYINKLKDYFLCLTFIGRKCFFLLNPNKVIFLINLIEFFTN